MAAARSSNTVHLIVNPVSGAGAPARRMLSEFCERLSSLGFHVSVHRTAGPGDAAVLARQCCERPCRVLVVAGGDGTVREAASGMPRAGVPMLVLPAGTENILAKYLGMTGKAEWLCEVLRANKQSTFDVATMNGRPFLLMAGVGFDADVVRRLAACRTGPITRLDYFGPIWRAFWGFRHPALRVETDGEFLTEGRGPAYVGIVPRYAVGLRILDRAVPNDGLLDVCVLRCSGRLSLLRHAMRILLRRHTRSSEVTYRQARRVRITSNEPMGIQLDGDWAGFGPAEFGIRQNAIRFLVPPGWTPNVSLA